MTTTSKSILENIYLFKGLSADQLEVVANLCDVEMKAPGEDVFCEKDRATSLYIIKYGSVRIHTKSANGDNIEVANLGRGSHFGEMAFLDGEKRSASATAMEKSEIIRVEYVKLLEMLNASTHVAVHFYRELAKFLCTRLRVTTNDMGFAREQNLSHF